jgi:predicted XRE-type DNA-binding protein
MKAEKLLIEKASGNVFADIGFNTGEAANLVVRADCMMALTAWYRQSELTQASAAKLNGVRRRRLNALLQGAVGEFSLDALVNMAALAGLSVKLSIKVPKRRAV